MALAHIVLCAAVVWSLSRAPWSLRASFALALVSLGILSRPYPTERLDRARTESAAIVDRHGLPLYEARSALGGYGRWVGLAEISPHLIAVTLSSEDAGFHTHPGVDPAGVARAIWLNLGAGRVAYGGSTLTQQLVGILEPRPRTLLGKLAEADAALRLERALSKDEILEQYLNRVHYGRLAHGAEAASQRFFGKSARELELHEAALLAILPRAPSAYDPARYPERAKRRRAHVLSRMAARGWIDTDEAERAARAPIRLVDAAIHPRARHLLDALPATRGPLTKTTLDLELQQRIERSLEAHLADLAARDVDQAGVVVIDNDTGDVLAMIGSRDYEDAQHAGAVNATLALRPAGSTLKPFVYALAMERGASPATPVFDVPTSWPGFVPRNANLEHAGLLSLRDALGSSFNVPAVRAAEEIGIERLSDLLSELELGSERSQAHGLSLALGSAPVRLVDLSNAYATLARGGNHLPWRLVDPERAPPAPRRVLGAESAFLVTSVLSDARARRREFGVETPLELPFPAAVKTGTSKSFCDNVVIGYTPELTVGVWVGNFDGRPMRSLLAMQGAAPLWRDAMLIANEGRPRRPFTAPSGVETRELCPLSGMLRGPHCPTGRHEHVAKQHAPKHSCDWHGPDGALRLPKEILAFRDRPRGEVVPDAGRTIEIASPEHGARFTIDPRLPRSRQALRLSALVGTSAVGRVRWEIDGRSLGEVPAPFSASWPIEPGRHRLRAIALARDDARAPREIAHSDVWIEVIGGTR